MDEGQRRRKERMNIREGVNYSSSRRSSSRVCRWEVVGL